MTRPLDLSKQRPSTLEPTPAIGRRPARTVPDRAFLRREPVPASEIGRPAPIGHVGSGSVCRLRRSDGVVRRVPEAVA
jgi:hypothetical protein